jgi:hypothetical protein
VATEKNFKVKNGLDSGGVITGTSFVKTGGTSSQYLLADGTVTTTGAGGIKYTFSATPPASPTAGDIWVDTSDGTSYTYINDGDSNQWVDLNGRGLSTQDLEFQIMQIMGAY